MPAVIALGILGVVYWLIVRAEAGAGKGTVAGRLLEAGRSLERDLINHRVAAANRADADAHKPGTPAAEIDDRSISDRQRSDAEMRAIRAMERAAEEERLEKDAARRSGRDVRRDDRGNIIPSGDDYWQRDGDRSDPYAEMSDDERRAAERARKAG